MFTYILECSSCKSKLPYFKFSKKSNSKRGYSYKCKSCHNSYVREIWYKKNSDKHKKSVRDWSLRNRFKVLSYKYGESDEFIRDLFLKSNNSCNVCYTKDDLCVDHCHTSGKIRGVLCRSCNVSLGLLKEDVGVIKSLADYLESNNCEIF